MRRSALLVYAVFALVALVAVVSGCKGGGKVSAAATVDPARRAAVEAALEKYSGFVAKMDDEGISEMFTTNGEMGSTDGKPLVGRAAILRHLARLHDYKVQSNVVTSESVTFEGADTYQKGTYRQTVQTPSGNTLQVQGKLEAVWTLDKDGAWRLKKLTAIPDHSEKPKE